MKTVDHKTITLTIDHFFTILENFHTFKGDALIAVLIRTCYKKQFLNVGTSSSPMKVEFFNSSHVHVKGYSKTSLYMYWETVGDIVINDWRKKTGSEFPDAKLVGVSFEENNNVSFRFRGAERNLNVEEEL